MASCGKALSENRPALAVYYHNAICSTAALFCPSVRSGSMVCSTSQHRNGIQFNPAQPSPPRRPLKEAWRPSHGRHIGTVQRPRQNSNLHSLSIDAYQTCPSPSTEVLNLAPKFLSQALRTGPQRRPVHRQGGRYGGPWRDAVGKRVERMMGLR